MGSWPNNPASISMPAIMRFRSAWLMLITLQQSSREWVTTRNKRRKLRARDMKLLDRGRFHHCCGMALIVLAVVTIATLPARAQEDVAETPKAQVVIDTTPIHEPPI